MVGLHSPFGLIGQIKNSRGISQKEVMWGQPWLLYVLEMADQLRWDPNAKRNTVPVLDSADDIKNALQNRR